MIQTWPLNPYSEIPITITKALNTIKLGVLPVLQEFCDLFQSIIIFLFSPIFSRKSQKFTKIAFWMKNRSSWKNKVNGEIMWKRLKLRRKKIRQLSLTTPKRHYFWLYFLLSLLFRYWGIYIQNGFHRKFWEIYHT